MESNKSSDNFGKIIASDYKPSWWCLNRHIQTLYPTLYRKKISLKLYGEYFNLPDGDHIEINRTDYKKTAPVIIVLHGLEGSINSPYSKGILKTINENGWQDLFMHFRGCSGPHNMTNRTYHSGDTGDLDFLIKTFKKLNPERDIAALGVSLGANVLLKYLGEQGENSPLKAAMAISAPFDLANSAKQLNAGFSKFYQRKLIIQLRNKIRDKFAIKGSPIPLDNLDDWNDFYSFDDNVTAPLHGFDGADDYYKKSSCKQYLKDITVPTLILHSKDDPFMTKEAIPTAKELSPSTTLELTNRGGHVGFIYGSPFNEKYWIEKRLTDFFKTHFN